MNPVVRILRRIPRSVAVVALCASAGLAASCARLSQPVAAPPPTPVTAAGLKSIAAEPGRRVVLINVWATWCRPCRQELPDLVRLRREWQSQGVDVLLVSADFDKPTDQLVAFLTQNGIDFPTYLKTEKDADFMKGLEPDWSGAIPATFLYSGGQLVDFWEGMATYETFARKAKEALAAPSPAGG